MYLGDIRRAGLLRFAFNTAGVGGASITRGTDGVLRIYRNAQAADTSVAGITTVEDAFGVGTHSVAIDTSVDPAFYRPGFDYTVVLTGATIDNQNVNAVLAEFSIDNRDRMVVSQGQLGAGSAGGFTLQSGVRANVRVGDALRVVGKGFKIIATYDSGTGVGTFRSNMGTALAANDWYEVIAMPDAEPIGAVDLATDAIGSAQLAATATAEIAAAVFARAFPASENSYTFEQIVRLMSSILAGLVGGMNSNAPVFQNLASSGNVASYTTDANGNRTARTLTP